MNHLYTDPSSPSSPSFSCSAGVCECMEEASTNWDDDRKVGITRIVGLIVHFMLYIQSARLAIYSRNSNQNHMIQSIFSTVGRQKDLTMPMPCRLLQVLPLPPVEKVRTSAQCVAPTNYSLSFQLSCIPRPEDEVTNRRYQRYSQVLTSSKILYLLML